jgi:hypothetical protein
VANQMIFEINLMAGKMLILQHQIIEVMKISPRHIVENLNVDYKEKIREKWNASILRSVIPTSDFSLPSEENIIETHKKLAKNKRADNNGFDLPEFDLNNNFSSSKEADQLKVEDLSIFGQAEIHPIIFEECYVKDNDPKFVNLVKSKQEVFTEEGILAFESFKP